MVARAQQHGFGEAAHGCVAGECGECRQVPVHVRRHKRTGEQRHAWLLERPDWDSKDYDVVQRFSCFYACRKFHLHHCAVNACDSLDRGTVVEADNGDVMCAVSGRILHTGTTYDWKERKKGQYTVRRARRPGPIVALPGAASRQTQHNANDWKLMQTSVNVVFDCLFSKLRHELYVNERRTKKRALESRVLQYSKRCKREGTFAKVARFQQIAIESGFFSSRTYATVVGRQDSRDTMRFLAPLLVALYKTLNAMTAQPTFKCYPAFAIAALYTTQRGIKIAGVSVVDRVRHIECLLPHPNAIEGFFRFLWAFYAESTTTQRSFLTKTKNAIKATLRKLKDAGAALQFKRSVDALALALRQKYYSLVEKEVDRV